MIKSELMNGTIYKCIHTCVSHPSLVLAGLYNLVLEVGMCSGGLY